MTRLCACGAWLTADHADTGVMLRHVRSERHRRWARRQVHPSFPVPTIIWGLLGMAWSH
jgi:hypothetical protein